MSLVSIVESVACVVSMGWLTSLTALSPSVSGLVSWPVLSLAAAVVAVELEPHASRPSESANATQQTRRFMQAPAVDRDRTLQSSGSTGQKHQQSHRSGPHSLVARGESD